MSRITLEDIKIKKPANTKSSSEVKPLSTPVSSYRPKLERTPQIKTRAKIISRPVAILLVLLLLGGGIYWSGNFFEKADIIITTKHQNINYENKPFTASKDLNSNAIDFEIMMISDSISKNIILTETKDVSIKAEGSITLYNTFSTTPQKIPAGTFLADTSGKTYKTNNTVTIPPFKMENKQVVPGQVEVKISAFLAGDSYNETTGDFFITSFKGTTKYNKIYGKLKTPLSGGASGLVYTLNEEDIKKITNISQSSVKEQLLKKVNALVPSGYILYPEALTFSYDFENNIMSKTPEAEVKINGTLAIVLLNEKSLVENITKISLPDVKGEEVKEINILNLNKLSFDFSNQDQMILKDLNSIPFMLTGEFDVVWRPDVESLKQKLLGIPKNDVLSVFRQDPGISSAIVRIFPPWQKHIPNNKTNINIKVDE